MGVELRFYMQDIAYFMAVSRVESGFRFRGYYSEPWKIIIDYLNITITNLIHKGVGRSLGDIYSPTNGSYCIGYLLRNETDVCMCQTMLKPEALQYIEYTSLSAEDTIKIMSVTPIFEINNALGFLSTFQQQVWVAYLTVIFISYFIWAVSLNALARTRSRLSGYKNYNAVNVIWNGLSVTFGNGIILKPLSSGERFGWMAFVLGSFWILASFSGGLLSKLTLPRAFRYYETIPDLIEYPNIEVALSDGDNEKYFFQKPEDNFVQEMVKRNTMIYLHATEFYIYIYDLGVGKKVYIGGEDFSLVFFSIYKLINDDNPIYFPKVSIKNSQYHFVFNRNLPENLKDTIKNVASVIFESNIGRHILQRDVAYFKDRNEKFLQVNARKSLKMDHLDFSIKFMLIGNAMAVFVAIVEMVLGYNYNA